MEWDAVGMHVWLLNLSWQQEPVGSIPNDMGLLRRWLRLPSGFADADRVWARVWPQIREAWYLEGDRWFNAGMVRAWKRQQTYKQNGKQNVSKNRAKVIANGTAKAKQSLEDEDIDSLKEESQGKEWTGDDLAHHLLREIGIVDYDNLAVVVSKALELKAKQPNFTMEKAFIHIRDRALVAKGAKFRSKWRDWFAGGDYDKPLEVW